MCYLCDKGHQPTARTRTNVLVKTQVRFPRSKKQRIRKKWSKMDRNFKYKPAILELGDSLWNGLKSLQFKRMLETQVSP